MSLFGLHHQEGLHHQHHLQVADQEIQEGEAAKASILGEASDESSVDTRATIWWRVQPM